MGWLQARDQCTLPQVEIIILHSRRAYGESRFFHVEDRERMKRKESNGFPRDQVD